MEFKDWVSLVSLSSTLILAVVTLLLNNRRDIRQEKQRREDRERDHQLKIREKEFELKYGKLQERRIQAMSELYERLVTVSRGMDIIPFFLEPVEKSAQWRSVVQKADKDCEDCALFFAKNRLYFSKDLADHISDVISTFNSFSLAVTAYLDFNELDKLKDALAKWEEDRKSVVDMLKQIEDEFRGLIGSAN